MTTTGDYSAAPTITPVPVPGPPPRTRPRLQVPRRLVPGLVVALLAVVAGAGYVVNSRDGAPVDTRPVVLPATFAGLGPAEASQQFAQRDSQWRDGLADAYGDRPFDGRAYGRLADRVRINVVVNRGHAADVGDASFGRPPFTDYGAVSCTHTLQLPKVEGLPETGPVTYPRIFLCLRDDATASVSAFALLGAQGREADVAAAVDQVWSQQQQRAGNPG